MNATLNVYCNELLVGVLNLTTERCFEFHYEDVWLKNKKSYPISIQLPLDTEIYPDRLARPFFENLLPESEVRKLIAHQFGISEKNVFGLLESIGGECAGAISLYPPNQSPKQSGEYIPLSENDLDNMVNELPKHPFMANRQVRLSLAGVQNKLPVYIKKNQFYVPKGYKPSSHILKPAITHFSNSVINEYYCMTLAKHMGLPVPKVMLHRHVQPLYIIERFDRVKDSDGQLIRLHQEDFCQALGLLSDQKYESEGGPSLQACFDLVRKYSIQPAIDLENLLHWVFFNFLIGNADAHGKNLAFIITEKGPQLAPFYDLLCTHIYPGLDEGYAMKIGGENRPKWIQKRHWERFSDALKFKFKFVVLEIELMVEKINAAISKTITEIGPINESEEQTILDINACIKKRIQQFNTLIRV